MSVAVPRSCVYCRTRFLIDSSDQADNGMPLGYWRIWSPSEKQITVDDLEQFSSSGCCFARFIFGKLQYRSNHLSGDSVILRCPPDLCENYPDSLIVGVPGQHPRFAHLTLMVDKDSPISHEVTQRPPNINPNSEGSFKLARTWLENCLDSHQSCSKPLGKFMPARVLEISVIDSTVCIRENISPAPYAVLSYCWGGPQRITLTNSRRNLGGWTIPQETLPLTIQDAVRVVRQLGLKYIWVDSLCIIQDDEADMATQIGKMANIYQQSYVAISASRSAGAEEGFLHPRFPFGAAKSSMGFQLPYRTRDGQTGSAIIIEEDVSTEYINPLRKRGWAFQEFILSPRIIDYGQLGTTWICQDTETHTDGFSCPPPTVWSRRKFHVMESEIEKPADPNIAKNSADRLDFLHKLWTVIVQQYMKGALTCFNDRLPGLGGIAERMSYHLEDDYVAGGWRKCIWESLVWHNENGREWNRLPGYFAPSWSWASIPDGDIGFISTNHSFADEGLKVLTCQVEPVNQEAKYGAVKSGFLEVRGRVLTARYTHDRNSPGPDANSITFDDVGSFPPDIRDCGLYLDAIVMEAQEGEITLWLLCVCWDHKRNKMSGIFLRQLRDGTYIRWGLFSLNPTVTLKEDEARHLDLHAEWRSSIPTRTLTIV